MKQTLKLTFLSLTAFLLFPSPGPYAAEVTAPGPRPNVLIITVDDMSADSVGAFGCRLPDTTPNLDRLAAQGMRFTRAHVVCANCMPSRNAMWSGLVPHHNGVEGFYQVPDARHPHLADLMKDAGYLTAIQHKVSHSTPYAPYPAWDLDLDTGPDGRRRDVKAPGSYGEGTAQGIQAAREAGKPFCLVINVADPHKPFYAESNRGETILDKNVPTCVFAPGQVPIPGFLFDDPVVRKELSHYYSSVRRADDCVGEILAALDASGQRDNTLVLFLSDHGMPLPFAKTQVYHHSTHTPLVLVVPGVTRPGSVDNDHLISAVDLLPTLLELTGVEPPRRLDGRSFAPLLEGGRQDGRDWVIKEYNENAGGSRDPMRAIQTRKFLSIFNPWSNGQRIMATATSGTPTYRRLAELARSDPALEARHKLYQFRVPEELYDVEQDPDCLNNLIDSPAHREELQGLCQTLEQWMIRTGDPMLDAFRHRDDAAVREAYVVAEEKEAEARRAGGRGKAKKKAAPKAASKRRAD
jgi:N-sulfoglucosamine sulfohydrolase